MGEIDWNKRKRAYYIIIESNGENGKHVAWDGKWKANERQNFAAFHQKELAEERKKRGNRFCAVITAWGLLVSEWKSAGRHHLTCEQLFCSVTSASIPHENAQPGERIKPKKRLRTPELRPSRGMFPTKCSFRRTRTWTCNYGAVGGWLRPDERSPVYFHLWA